MGAHTAPRARHTAAAPATRVARLAGRGAVCGSAAVALVGAGSGVALAHDDDRGPRGTLSDDLSLLCDVLGGAVCDTDSSGRDTDAGSSDDLASVFDHDEGDDEAPSRASDRSDDDTTGDRADPAPRVGSTDARTSTDTARDAASSSAGRTSAEPEDAGIDTPPPPGQVRTIKVPG